MYSDLRYQRERERERSGETRTETSRTVEIMDMTAEYTPGQNSMERYDTQTHTHTENTLSAMAGALARWEPTRVE